MKTSNIIFAIIIIAVVGFVMYASGLERKSSTTPLPADIKIEPITNTTVTIQPETVTNSIKPMTTAIITTNKGIITLELFADKAPKTVENFVKLANSGFYNGTRFHRVIKGFMIQGGDPLSKDLANQNRWGTGGPGYAFEDEIHAENRNVIGTIAMANAGPNTNGSQFFINVANNNFLDTKHTVFGRVSAGMDVVIAIENTKTTQPGDRPVEDMLIQNIEIK
ncbi:MAG: peptidylprolyl isomerase [Patescibacteria group bacterium]